jgi:hypothetical protein
MMGNNMHYTAVDTAHGGLGDFEAPYMASRAKEAPSHHPLLQVPVLR